MADTEEPDLVLEPNAAAWSGGAPGARNESPVERGRKSAGKDAAAKKPRIPPGSEKLVAIMSITIVILLIASALLANAVFGTRMVGALLTINKDDVFIRDARPSGDNLTAMVPIEIEMKNDGEGKSGELLLWCAAFLQDQTNRLKSDFNISQFSKQGDARQVTRLTEREKPGSIVRAKGELRLPPGEYNVRLRIYEDAGKRTLVSGSVDISVNQSQVIIQSPYKPQGRSPGRSYEAPLKMAGSTPGFDGILVLGAGLGAVGLAFTKKRPLRNFNMDLRRF